MIESCSITVVLRSEKFLKLHYTIQSCCKLLQVSFSFSKSLPNLYRPFYSFKEIFGPVPFFSSINPSLDTPGVTGLFFSSCARISGTLYHLILDLVYVPQNSKLFSKLIMSQVSKDKFCCVCFLFVSFCFVYCGLEHPAG